MRTLGILGGMSWESTVIYYRLLNEGVKARLGGLHSAKLLLNSVDFAPIEVLQRAGDWDGAGALLADCAVSLAKGGAEAIVLATNTMHKVAPTIETAVDLPLIHIADATALVANAQGAKTVGLLGTAFTMQETFYKDRLTQHHGLAVLVPSDSQQNDIHRIIFEELCLGELRSTSKTRYLEVIDDLRGRGAEAIILGCTEIGLLVNQADTTVPLIDTTAAHVDAALDWALSP